MYKEIRKYRYLTVDILCAIITDLVLDCEGNITTKDVFLDT